MEQEPEPKPGEFKIQTYTQKQLAAFYHMSTRTLRRYVKRWGIGERFGSLYTPKQVQFIVDKLGKPFVLIIGVALRVFGAEFLDKKEK